MRARQINDCGYRQVLIRDNFTCRYCGVTARDAKVEVDHVTPYSKGGESTLDNLVTSCRTCNRLKKDKHESVSFVNPSLEPILLSEVEENICRHKRRVVNLPDSTWYALKYHAIYNDTTISSAIITATKLLKKD